MFAIGSSLVLWGIIFMVCGYGVLGGLAVAVGTAALAEWGRQ
jgi:hypothetical protein